MSSNWGLIRPGSDQEDSVYIGLLNMLLAQLPKEQQIAKITEALKMRFNFNKKEVESLLSALKTLFGYEEQYGPAFRAHLRQEFFNNLFKEKKDDRILSLLPSFQVLIVTLGHIIRGWRWIPKLYLGESRHLSSDAEECFFCVCKIFQIFVALENSFRPNFADDPNPYKKIREELERIFREHLELWRHNEDLEQLDLWMTRPETPTELMRLMYHLQARFLPPDLIRARVEAFRATKR